MKLYFIDFDDSFTYNIVCLLNRVGFDVEVFHWKKFHVFDTKIPIILGPGPGHPRDYTEFIQALNPRIYQSELFTGGICLGFQILLYSFGAKVEKSLMPLHGQSIEIDIPTEYQKYFDLKKANVQRYNSLSIKVSELDHLTFRSKPDIWSKNNEIYFFKLDNIWGMQFHPESVGTSCPDKFFQLIHLLSR